MKNPIVYIEKEIDMTALKMALNSSPCLRESIGENTHTWNYWYYWFDTHARGSFDTKERVLHMNSFKVSRAGVDNCLYSIIGRIFRELDGFEFWKWESDMFDWIQKGSLEVSSNQSGHITEIEPWLVKTVALQVLIDMRNWE